MAGKVSEKQKDRTSEEKDEMSLWGHLNALRGHLFRSTLAIVLFFIVAFVNREFIFDRIILAPLNDDFISNRALCRLGELLHMPSICLGSIKLNLININLSGQFLMHMYISFFTALTVASPYIIWEIWRFIRPALYENERKHSRGAVLVMSVLFILGLLFSFFLIVPLTLNFFGNYQVSDAVTNQIALNSYISTVISVTFSMGIIFELPVFVFFLAKVGILTPEFLRRNRRYMIVILLTVAAIITPPDVVSQILVVIPLWGLYELSIVVAARAIRKAQKITD
ncbi:MAG: twin-arginine translocase subunit TatC [Lentimicrobiaceae bacterium]|nr:twin-arginine translocase subunit TatC [Lentimicrobiaceae bacterium]